MAIAAPPAADASDYDGKRPLRLLMLGRISRIKGQDLLIEALTLLPKAIAQRLDVRIVGDSFQNDAVREAALRKAVTAAGLDSIVRFEPFQADTAPLYRWADVVAVPSRLPESLGRVAIEAMAHCRPPLVARIGGLTEIVEDGVTGWVVPPNDADALERTIGAIVTRPDAWRGYGTAARGRFEKTFAARNIARQFQAVVRARFGADARSACSQRPRLGVISPMPRDIIQLGRNFLLSLGGEGLQSGFHFVLSLILIRLLSPHDFGIFAIAFVLGGISLTYGNALVSIPAAVSHSATQESRCGRFSGSGVRLDRADDLGGHRHYRHGRPVACRRAVGGSDCGRHVRRPVDAAQSRAQRDVCTSRNGGRYAVGLQLFDDGVLLVGGVLGLLPDLPQLTGVLLALTGANIVAIFVALRALGRRVRISLRASVWHRYRAIWSDVAWSLFGTTTWNVQGQALMFLVAAIVGPAAYAPLAAGAVLFTPLRPAIAAFINVFRPDFAAALARGQLYRLRLTMYSIAALIIFCCVGVGGTIWLGWPLLDTYIFGGKFGGASMPLIVALSGLCGSNLFYLQRSARTHSGCRSIQTSCACDHIRRDCRSHVRFDPACRHIGCMVLA